MTGQLTSNRLCPAQAVIHTLPDVLLRWASDIKRMRLAVGLCRKLSCTCVLWSVPVCPMLISTLASCMSHMSDTISTQWHYGCQENLCWLGGSKRLTKTWDHSYLSRV